MGSETNAVNLDAVALDKLDNALSTVSLGAIVLKIVVVVEQLSLRVDLGGELEGQRQESLANGVVPHALTVGTILFES